MVQSLAVLVAVLAVATVFGVLRRRRDGRLRRQPAADERRLDATDLGEALGQRATVVQFSTASCRVCRPTRAMLGDLVAGTQGVRFVDVSAEERLPLARRLGVLRTPTVLVLDPDGRIVYRGSGQPERAAVQRALQDVLQPGPGVG